MTRIEKIWKNTKVCTETKAIALCDLMDDCDGFCPIREKCRSAKTKEELLKAYEELIAWASGPAESGNENPTKNNQLDFFK